MSGGTLGVIGGTLVGSGGGPAGTPYLDEVLTDTPLAYWPLDEASNATTATDLSGNGRNATYTGLRLCAGATPVDELAHSFAPAIGGTALGRGSIADEAAWDTTTLTLEGWVKPSEVAATSSEIFGRDANSGAGTRVFQFWRGTANLNWTCFLSGTARTVTASSVFTANVWYHVAAVVSGATMTIYIDGASAATDTFSGTLDSGAIGIGIGSQHGGANLLLWRGGLAGLAVYNSALSGARIAAHYAAGS